MNYFSITTSDSISCITLRNAKEGCSEFNFWNARYIEDCCQIVFFEKVFKFPFCTTSQFFTISLFDDLIHLYKNFFAIRFILIIAEIYGWVIHKNNSMMKYIQCIIKSFENFLDIQDTASIYGRESGQQSLGDIHLHGFLYFLRTEILQNRTYIWT